MTYKDAIFELNDMYDFDEPTESNDAIDMAITALEKQIPKKPEEYEDKYYACPVCGNVLLHKWEKYPTKLMSKNNGLPYCLSCGQAIDWSEEE